MTQNIFTCNCCTSSLLAFFATGKKNHKTSQDNNKTTHKTSTRLYCRRGLYKIEISTLFCLKMEPCIIVHGGSRTILGDEKKEKHRKGVQLAARKGHEVLLKVGFNLLALVVLKIKD